MESQSKTTILCSQCNRVRALYVTVEPQSIISLPTTITVQVKCEGCFAPHATKRLGISETISNVSFGLQIT